jgi:hypothetical protein
MTLAVNHALAFLRFKLAGALSGNADLIAFNL